MSASKRLILIYYLFILSDKCIYNCLEDITRRQLIVGIDPGTTTGICLLGLDGRVVAVGSRKGFSRPVMARFIQKHGHPLIMASDITPPPKSIEKAASSFGARLFFPEIKMTKEEKLSAVEKSCLNGPKWANRHERDAIFAAMHAWGRIKPLMERIDTRIKAENADPALGDSVKRSVILEGRNIAMTIGKLSQRKAPAYAKQDV